MNSISGRLLSLGRVLFSFALQKTTEVIIHGPFCAFDAKLSYVAIFRYTQHTHSELHSAQCNSPSPLPNNHMWLQERSTNPTPSHQQSPIYLPLTPTSSRLTNRKKGRRKTVGNSVMMSLEKVLPRKVGLWVLSINMEFQI